MYGAGSHDNGGDRGGNGRVGCSRSSAARFREAQFRAAQYRAERFSGGVRFVPLMFVNRVMFLGIVSYFFARQRILRAYALLPLCAWTVLSTPVQRFTPSYSQSTSTTTSLCRSYTA